MESVIQPSDRSGAGRLAQQQSSITRRQIQPALVRIGVLDSQHRQGPLACAIVVVVVVAREPDSFLHVCAGHRRVRGGAQLRFSEAFLDGWSVVGGQQQRTTFLIQRAASNDSTILFDQVQSPLEQTTKLDEIFATLINVLTRAGFSTIYRVVLTKPTDPLHVVRILIPKMEFYDPVAPRVGVRLANVFKQ